MGSLQWVELAHIVGRHYRVNDVADAVDEVELPVQTSDHMSVAGAGIEAAAAESGYEDADYRAVVADLAAVGDGRRLKAAHIVPGVEVGQEAGFVAFLDSLGHRSWDQHLVWYI